MRWRTLLATLLLAWACHAGAATLLAVTTELPPFQSAQGWGIALQEARELARRNGDTLEIRFLPWPRALQIARNTPNVLIFSLPRSEAEGPDYGWVGEIAPNDVTFWKLSRRTDIQLNDLNDARRWQLGVTEGDSLTLYLLGHGFKPGRNLQSASDDLTNIRKLFAGRIDLLPFANRLVLRNLALGVGLNPQWLTPALELPQLSGHLYLAFSPGSDPKRTRRYALAYHAMRTEGFLRRERQMLGLPTAPPPLP